MTGPALPTGAPPGPRRVVVDTDTGIDDALALLLLAADPTAELVAVTTVYGNCTVDDALRNVAHVLRLAGLPDVPVARGAAGPLEGAAHIAHYVHGHDGLGDVLTDRPAAPAALDALPAPERLVALGHEHPGELDLLALGPLTNLGAALRIDPDLLTRYRSVVVMGGSGPFPPVGTMHMVDANVQNDPVAAAAVFTAPATHRVMVGVDLTARVVLDEQDLVALHRSGTPTGEFAGAVLEPYLDFYRLAWGRRVCPAHDTVAAAVLLHPEWVTRAVTGPAGVTHDGFSTRARILRTADGRPVPWPVPTRPPTTAVLEVDQGAVLGALRAALVGPALP